MTDKERFLTHVEMVNGHWIWTGAQDGRGRGTIRDSSSPVKKQIKARKRAYELFIGPVPEETYVYHIDPEVKLCVNPECSLICGVIRRTNQSLRRIASLEKQKERFIRQIRVEGTHWIWVGGRGGGNGEYGVAWDPERGNQVLAHRRSYELFVGPIPEGKMILHKHEGMPLCVAPDCLYPGDQVDNADDFIKAGGKYSVRKLTPEAVHEIRYGSSSVKELIEKYEIHYSTVFTVRARRTHRDLP